MAETNFAGILSSLRDIQPGLKEMYGVAEFWVFGSYARGEQKATSDVDILVEFDRPGMSLLKFVDVEMRLTEHVGVKVDLVRRSALRPKIRSYVLQEAIPV